MAGLLFANFCFPCVGMAMGATVEFLYEISLKVANYVYKFDGGLAKLVFGDAIC